MERQFCWCTVSTDIFCAEHLDCRTFRCCGECEERLVCVSALTYYAVNKFIGEVNIFHVDLLFLCVFLYGYTNVDQASAEHSCTFTALSLMCFINDDSKFLSLIAVHILVAEQELLHSADYDLLAVVDRFCKAVRVFLIVNRFYQPDFMLKTVDRIL